MDWNDAKTWVDTLSADAQQAVDDQMDRIGGLWQAAAAGNLDTKATTKAMQGALGDAVTYSAKAWVATRTFLEAVASKSGP